MSEANKEIIRRYQEAYNSGDLDVLDEILAPDWVTNAWVEGVPKSVEAAKQFYAMATSVFPDLHVTTDDLIAEGDRVVIRVVGRGTHDGEFQGIRPTGRTVVAEGIGIGRIAGGRIAESWAAYDALGMMRQLGVLADPGAQTP